MCRLPTPSGIQGYEYLAKTHLDSGQDIERRLKTAQWQVFRPRGGGVFRSVLELVDRS